MGYTLPPKDALDALIRRLIDAERRIAELERPTGTQTAGAVKKLQDLVNGILTQVNGVFSGYVQAGGDVTSTGGTGSFAAGLTSTGAAALDVATIPGGRQTTWQHISSGRIGYASSSLTRKQNLRPVTFSAASILSLQARIYEYKAQAAIRDDPDNEYYDPTYVVPDEIGLIAEDLIAAGLSIYVFFEEDGVTPKGINYDLFASTALLIVAQEQQRQISALTERLDELQR